MPPLATPWLRVWSVTVASCGVCFSDMFVAFSGLLQVLHFSCVMLDVRSIVVCRTSSVERTRGSCTWLVLLVIYAVIVSGSNMKWS